MFLVFFMILWTSVLIGRPHDCQIWCQKKALSLNGFTSVTQPGMGLFFFSAFLMTGVGRLASATSWTVSSTARVYWSSSSSWLVCWQPKPLTFYETNGCSQSLRNWSYQRSLNIVKIFSRLFWFIKNHSIYKVFIYNSSMS